MTSGCRISLLCLYRQKTSDKSSLNYYCALLTKFVSPPIEQEDVHNFLLNNMTNGGLLDVMMRYLKAVGQKFTVEWPRGLAAVVLEVHQTWRKHSGGLPNPLLRDCSNQHIQVNDKKTG